MPQYSTTYLPDIDITVGRPNYRTRDPEQTESNASEQLTNAAYGKAIAKSIRAPPLCTAFPPERNGGP